MEVILFSSFFIISIVVLLEIGIENLNGVYINETTKNGSASKAGIKSGDIIKKIGTKPIKNVTELQEQISQFRPGDEITVIVDRDNKEIHSRKKGQHPHTINNFLKNI